MIKPNLLMSSCNFFFK